MNSNSNSEASIRDNQFSGVNLRVTADAHQGQRPTMEDEFSVAYHATKDAPNSNPKDVIYVYVGVFDGHGGSEASTYAREHLMDHIISQEGFRSGDDEPVLGAIRDGFLEAQKEMQRERINWKRTPEGFLSNAGTTASVAFFMRGKLFIGHVGDSAIILGYKDLDDPPWSGWKARKLTKDHKLNDPVELARIEESGGSVATDEYGHLRVVWQPESVEHLEKPLLIMSRALGNFWSYNPASDKFVVSPEPDTFVIEIDPETFRCLVIASDGVLDMLRPDQVIDEVCQAHLSNMGELPPGVIGRPYYVNPSRNLVDTAICEWVIRDIRPDNATAVTVMINPTPTGSPNVHEQNNVQNESASAMAVPIAAPTPTSTRGTVRPRVLRNMNSKRHHGMSLRHSTWASTRAIESDTAIHIANGRSASPSGAFQDDGMTGPEEDIQRSAIASSVGVGGEPSEVANIRVLNNVPAEPVTQNANMNNRHALKPRRNSSRTTARASGPGSVASSSPVTRKRGTTSKKAITQPKILTRKSPVAGSSTKKSSRMLAPPRKQPRRGGSSGSSVVEESSNEQAEKILKKRSRCGKVSYFVKWRGSPESEGTWMTKAFVKRFPKLLEDYRAHLSEINRRNVLKRWGSGSERGSA